MANWDGTKPISTNTLNGGNQYTTDSQLSVQALNSIVESGLFSQNFVRNLRFVVTDTGADEYPNGPVVELVPQASNTNYIVIRINGIKGKTGDKGNKGDTGNTGVGIQSITITES